MCTCGGVGAAGWGDRQGTIDDFQVSGFGRRWGRRGGEGKEGQGEEKGKGNGKGEGEGREEEQEEEKRRAGWRRRKSIVPHVLKCPPPQPLLSFFLYLLFLKEFHFPSEEKEH